MLDVYLLITNNCNLKCGHCYGNYGPGGKTMTKPQLEAVLRHLPKNTARITLSGGEATTQMEALRFALGFIQEQRETLYPQAKVVLETNGTWVRNQESAYQILHELSELGLAELQISSIDDFHRAAGVNTKLLGLNGLSPLSLALFQLVETAHQHLFVVLSGGSHCVPLGRGRDLPANFHRHAYCSLERNLRDFPAYGNVTIGPDGGVFPCCWQVTPEMGSAFEYPVAEILRRSLATPLFRTLVNFGPSAVAANLNLTRDNPRTPSEYDNYCHICFLMFDQARKLGLIE